MSLILEGDCEKGDGREPPRKSGGAGAVASVALTAAVIQEHVEGASPLETVRTLLFVVQPAAAPNEAIVVAN